VGNICVYESWLYGDEGNKWTVEMEFVDKITVNSIDYYLLQVTNYNNDGVTDYDPSTDKVELAVCKTGRNS